MLHPLLRSAALLAATVLAGCAVDSASDDPTTSDEDELVARSDDAWFYTGPLPALSNTSVTVSLKGHTAHVTGYVPAGTDIPPLPHVRAMAEGARVRLDIVYPIATARPGKSNSRPGSYAFYMAKPYRPDGLAITRDEGEHHVPWGGFPFLAYNQGIAFHGPITSELSRTGDQTVWYLMRGTVSGGCNRMQGENVIELAHVLGVNMRKVYGANQMVYPPNKPVNVIEDYDTYDGKFIDVDYPTDTGVTRPAKVHGADKVAMFGSWVSSMMPNGRDLPRNLKWEGGVPGEYYVFSEHALPNMVCAIPKADLPAVKTFASSLGGELPKSLCEKKACILEALRARRDAKASCGL